MSTLAGLKRLEAQIYQAMMEVGAPEAAQALPSDAPRPAPEQLVEQARQGMSQASGMVQQLDIQA
ncbi:MAG: hypothetical protein ABUL72_06900 [Armatimonadota bacterium]